MQDRVALYAATRNLYHDMTVAAKSLLYHNGADKVIFLVEDDVFPEQLPACVSTMNVSEQQYFRKDGPNYSRRWTYMVLMRCALTKLFPDMSRILTLDVDTFVRKPIDYIWNLDISDFYFAAVAENQIVGRTHPYYNFGVVLHNLTKLRDDQADDTIINTINTVYKDYCEQDAANSVCKYHILGMPQEYNALKFNKPRVPEENIVIKHYACDKFYRNSDDYTTFDHMTWRQVFDHAGRTEVL